MNSSCEVIRMIILYYDLPGEFLIALLEKQVSLLELSWLG